MPRRVESTISIAGRRQEHDAHEEEENDDMGLINWIFDFYQQYRIDQLRDESSRTRAEAASVRTSGGGIDAERLERALGELALAVKTVQRIAVEKGLCSAEELQEKLRTIDREDGQVDGRAPLR